MLLFLEDDYVKAFKPCSKTILEETIRSIPTINIEREPSPPTIDVRVRDEEENINTHPSISQPRCSGRVSREPYRYRGFEANVADLDANDGDPVSYKDAMVDTDKDKWLDTMNQEIESIHSNSV